MDILAGIHGSFQNEGTSTLSGGLVHTVLSDYGEMLFQGIRCSFGDIWLSHYRIIHEASMSAEAGASSLEAMHMLSGDISFNPQGLAQPLQMKNAHWQFLHLPYVANKVVFPAGTNLMTLDFHYSRPWLETMVPYFRDLSTFLEKVDRGEAAVLATGSVPISKEVLNLVAGLFKSRHTELSQNLFLERFAIDWLAKNLESPYLAGSEELKMKNEEKALLMEIRDFIHENLMETLPVSQLARQAHMNEYKFASLFKLLFKLSPHQYIIEQRLELGARLVIKGEISITEISTLAGYETPAAFSKIFKKVYGHPPSLYKEKITKS
jgi:AraC-like DNA-binding protein